VTGSKSLPVSRAGRGHCRAFRQECNSFNDTSLAWRDELPRVRRRARHCMTGSCNSPLQPGPCATHGPEGAPGGLCNCLRRVSGAKHDSPAGFRTSDRISSSLIAPVVIPSICRVRIGLTSGRTGCSSCRSTECRRLSLQALNHEKLRTCHPITRGQALNLSPCLREAYPEPVTLSEGGGGGGRRKSVKRQDSRPGDRLSARSGIEVGADNS
jgi:hypothetical protein